VTQSPEKATLEGILAELEQAAEFDRLQNVSEQLRDFFEIDHLVYHWVSGWDEQFGFGTYSDKWIERYVAMDYLRIDPVVQGCVQRFHPVDWRKLDWTSKHARIFLEDALDHDVGNQGYSIPIHGPNGQFALFNVSNNCDEAFWDAFTEKRRRELILIAHLFNHAAIKLVPGRVPEQMQALTPREMDALTFLAMGYSRAQVADTLSISEHTLRVYIESARSKLAAANTTHAVAQALTRGLIVI